MSPIKTVIHQRFTDFDQLREKIQQWDLEFRLLEGTGFDSQILQLISADAHAGYVRIERKVDQAGSTPPGFRTFVIPEENCRSLWWHGHNVGNRNLLVFPQDGELKSVSERNFEVYLISLRIPYIEQLADILGRPTISEGGHVYLIPKGRMIKLRSLARQVMLHPDSKSHIHRVAEALVLNTGSENSVNPPRLRAREKAISSIVDCLGANPDTQTDLSSLCRIANVSERTLQYAFMERYGMPPNVFARRWKLNTARRLLVMAEPGEQSVGEVSLSLGFNSHSLFTREYRQLFGELPSESLARNA